MINDTITAIQGIQVGHASLSGIPSGCTVLLPEGGATAGVDIRGGAPGTYGADTLNPLNLVDRIHGLFLTGGSVFGLSVADGLRSFLKERGVGFDTGHGRVPIVVGAVIFDLGVNPSGSHPDAALGYEACTRVSPAPVSEGAVGAGLGATVGKLYGLSRAMKGGLGSFCLETATGIQVGALVTVNAFGTVVDPSCGRAIAGCRESAQSLNLVDVHRDLLNAGRLLGFPSEQNTVIGVVATNVKFNKTQLTKIAQMAHDGLARTVYPAHTLYDGDTLFALSCGAVDGGDVNVVGSLAAHVTGEAILRAVRKTGPWKDLPACADLPLNAV